MQTIYKYTIEVTDDQKIEMPKGAQILTVQVQGNEVCLWALVDPDLKKELRHIEVFGTGHNVSDDERTYIGTFQLHGAKIKQCIRSHAI